MLESELLGIQLSWGAARVEDTYDLLGHTLRKALGVMARKPRRVRVDGYKRLVLSDLDTGLIRAVGMTPADVAEDTVTEAIAADLHAQQVMLEELHIDRA